MEINEENLKGILEEQREEFQRYIGTLSEDFQSQVKLIAESLSGLQKQLLAIREMVAKNTEDIERLKIELIAMRSDITETKKDIEIMKSDIQFIKQGFKRKVDLDEFEALEKRVLILERDQNRQNIQGSE